MKIRATCVVLALLGVIAFTAFGQADDKESARKAIRKILDDQDAAWNKGDLQAFMAGYWKSDELTFFSGKDVTKGWNATLVVGASTNTLKVGLMLPFV